MLSDVIFQTIISFICTTVGREGEKPCISAPLCQISSFLIRIAALEIRSFHLAACSSSNINKTNNPVCFVFIFNHSPFILWKMPSTMLYFCELVKNCLLRSVGQVFFFKSFEYLRVTLKL